MPATSPIIGVLVDRKHFVNRRQFLERSLIERIAASLHAGRERSSVCVLTTGSRRLALGLLLLRLLLCPAATNSTRGATDGRASGSAGTRISGNGTTLCAQSRSACCPTDCLTAWRVGPNLSDIVILRDQARDEVLLSVGFSSPRGSGNHQCSDPIPRGGRSDGDG